MQFKPTKLTVACILTLFLSTLPSLAQAVTPKPVTGSNGVPPRVSLVEQPQDALRVWGRDKEQNRTLVLISSNIGIMSTREKDNPLIDGLAAKGDWDGLLSRDFPTARYYPVTASNYLYVAHRTGIISEVYWIPPAKSSVGQEPMTDFKGFLADLGVQKGELDALKQDNKSIGGTLNGVPVHIYSLKDLPKIKDDALILIDLSTFQPYYTDEVKTPILDLFGAFIGALGDADINASDVAVSLSTAFGPVPIEYRFLGSYLNTYLSNPASLKDGPLKTWRLRSDGMYYKTFSQYDEQKEACEEAVKSDPADASLWYDLAVASFYIKDAGRLKESLDMAVALDRGYYPAYINYGNYFTSKEMPGEAEAFLKEAVRVNPDDPRGYNGLHDLYFSTGDYKEATDALTELVGKGFDGPENLAALADTYRKQKIYDKAEKYLLYGLAKLPQVDNEARLDMVLKLASVYEEDGKVEKSLATLQDALTRTADPHLKEQIQAKADAIRSKWAPFINPAPQKPSQ